MREVDLTVRISEGANREIIHRSDFFSSVAGERLGRDAFCGGGGGGGGGRMRHTRGPNS